MTAIENMKPGLSILTILLLVGSAFLSCKKTNNAVADNPYGLPNASQSGANIFACRVNDSNWVMQDADIFNMGTSFSGSNNRDSLWFFARSTANSTLHSIRFNIRDIIRNGSEFRLNDSTRASATAYSVFLNCKTSNTYGDPEWMVSIDGSIQFTRYSGTYSVPDCCTHGSYDANAILSGKFNFTVVFPGCDTIRVTEGRFDINYSQY